MIDVFAYYFQQFYQEAVKIKKMDAENRMQLMEEYVATLQRQNFAKNNETSLLYQQIQSIREENLMLRECIEALKQREANQKSLLQQQLLNKIPMGCSRNFEAELRASVDMNSMKIVAEDIRIELEQKQQQISRMNEQNQNLRQDVLTLKEELSKAADRVTKSEQKLRKQYEEIKRLEEQNFNAKNSRMDSKGSISFARLEVDKLVKQNNELIERVRILEKQKNSYYSQLKLTSPLKSRPSNLNTSSNSFLQQSRKKCSGKVDRWNIMEQKIRAIRNENQQLKANLAIE